MIDKNTVSNFLSFVRSKKCIVPEDFIIKYYILTSDIFISFADCLVWLKIQRDGLIKTLKTSYEKNIDYVEISKNEEETISKINLEYFKINSSRRKYYKLTTDCFKKIAMSSNSEVGKLTKTYYIEMERIVKDFSNYELDRLKKENNKLKNNLNPVKIKNVNGLYVWHYSNSEPNLYRIGQSKDIKERMNTHNSSHSDNLIIDLEFPTPCHEDLEKSVLIMLDSFRYRKNKDFFKCDLEIIEITIKNILDSMNNLRKDCPEIKSSSNVFNKIKTNKKTSKRISKKTSKRAHKK
jgi:phage anti-repressor protein